MIIEDGTGSGKKLLVDDNNQLHSLCKTQTLGNDAVEKGNAYNINTGWIDLTSSTASAVLYFKNTEAPVNGETAIIIDKMIVGIDSLGTTSGLTDIRIIKNPTAGTIVSGATNVDIKENRNFGSNQELASLAYKGAEGNTLTDGTEYIIIGQQAGTRVPYTITSELLVGSSLGITMDTQTSSGTTRVYVALIAHRVDGKNKEV